MKKSKLVIPKGYKSALTVYETQQAIESLKDNVLYELRNRLNLMRVTAPLFVTPESGMQDNLSGSERPVEFDIPAVDGKKAQVVQSLAKWKRMALKEQGFEQDQGIITDMNAIRRDEGRDDGGLDNIHSIYVDQWDWEKIIGKNERSIEYLQQVVRDIVESISEAGETTRDRISKKDAIKNINTRVDFVTSQELENWRPNLTPEQRENAFVRDGHPTSFVMQIGDKLKSGDRHGSRSPDYDDWSLNGDLVVWNPMLQRALELSSMGIRVDAATLERQLMKSENTERKSLDYHRAVLDGELPQTIGGGIGQSRLAMQFLGKAHIGEVQSSLWDKETKQTCKKADIKLL